MEKKSIIYRLSRVLALIMLLVSIIILLSDKEINKYEKIAWSTSIVLAFLFIISDVINGIKNKSKFIIKIESGIFFINWILLSSMLIICLFSNLGIISKIISLICLLAINYIAYRKYFIINKWQCMYCYTKVETVSDSLIKSNY